MRSDESADTRSIEVQAADVRRSHSSIEAYLRCGVAYKKQYLEGDRRITTRMAVGTAIAAGAEKALRKRMITGEGISMVEICEVTRDAYQDEVTSSEVVDHKSLAVAKDDAVQGSRVWRQMADKRYTKEDLICVEKELAARVEGVVLEGRPDVFTREGVGDLKCGRQWQRQAADSSRQLTRYGLLYKAETGYFPQKVWIDNLYRVDRRYRWEFQRLRSDRTQVQYRAMVNLSRLVDQRIQDGVFSPAPESAWWCSHRWCPFFEECEYAGGA
jgi:hypothetical protein